MTILVTGSSGHLGEALIRTLRAQGKPSLGIDCKPSPFTDLVASITDTDAMRRAMVGASAVIHCATLHKPHIATHGMQDFLDVNLKGTLVLLEAARDAGVDRFVFSSTTSSFGKALTPAPGAPAAWITEAVTPVPRNIYGTSKVMAEQLCELFHRRDGMAVIILRLSRFFQEEDDNPDSRASFSTLNAQANELLYRRIDIADAVDAHLLAVEQASRIGFGRYILSATTPFTESDLAELRSDAPEVVDRLFPQAAALYADQGWRMFPGIDRVYVNEAARRDLGWRPCHDFAHVLRCLERGQDFRSALARVVGSKPYHDQIFTDGPYPVAP